MDSFGQRPRAFSDQLTRRRFLQLLSLGSTGAVLAACGSSSGSGSTPSTKPSRSKSSQPASKLPTFPLGAASKASGTVAITMWHSMTNANLTTLQSLTRKFNASQSKIKVSLLNQASYTDTFTAYRAGLGSGALPDLVQMESILLQDMIDSQSVVPASSALRADSSFDAGDVLAAAMSFFTVDSVQYAMPWNCSSQVMYFNQKIFKAAGLDPAKPPTTFAEYHAMAAQAQSKAKLAYGTALKLTASNIEDWLAQSGALFLNHENGRAGRATAVEIGGPTGQRIFSFFGEMLGSKIAEPTLNTSFDNLIAIGNGSTAMSIDTSAALGTVLDLLGGGKYHNVTLGVGPLPGPAGPGDGVPYGGAGLYIVKHSAPERQDAAWEFIKYLLTPGAMATWAIGSGYIPITKSSVATPAVKSAWATTPQYKVAYEQVAASRANYATAGGVTGASSQVETDIENALSLISNGTAPQKALAEAVSTSNQAIASYNSSI
ncbi:MAG: ABC transporter substrate-binding protein [Acidimicrobiales bacterium]